MQTTRQHAAVLNHGKKSSIKNLSTRLSELYYIPRERNNPIDFFVRIR